MIDPLLVAAGTSAVVACGFIRHYGLHAGEQLAVFQVRCGSILPRTIGCVGFAEQLGFTFALGHLLLPPCPQSSAIQADSARSALPATESLAQMVPHWARTR